MRRRWGTLAWGAEGGDLWIRPSYSGWGGSACNTAFCALAILQFGWWILRKWAVFIFPRLRGKYGEAWGQRAALTGELRRGCFGGDREY